MIFTRLQRGGRLKLRMKANRFGKLMLPFVTVALVIGLICFAAFSCKWLVIRAILGPHSIDVDFSDLPMVNSCLGNPPELNQTNGSSYGFVHSVKFLRYEGSEHDNEYSWYALISQLQSCAEKRGEHTTLTIPLIINSWSDEVEWWHLQGLSSSVILTENTTGSTRWQIVVSTITRSLSAYVE